MQQTLEKLIFLQVEKKFFAFYGNLGGIIFFYSRPLLVLC